MKPAREGSLAWRLRRARRERGYSSAAKLAQAAGVSASSVSNIEAGIRVGPATLITLARVLAVPLDWLRDGAGQEPDWRSTTTEPARLFSWRAIQVAEIFDSITDPALAAKAYAIMVAFDERGQQALPSDTAPEPAAPLPIARERRPARPTLVPPPSK